MPATHAPVLLREATSHDSAALARLAALDSAAPVLGPTLVAERDGTLVAALELATGRAVADPFVATQAVVALLRLRGEDDRPSRRERIARRRRVGRAWTRSSISPA